MGPLTLPNHKSQPPMNANLPNEGMSLIEKCKSTLARGQRIKKKCMGKIGLFIKAALCLK